jgi:hypothetical protein
MTMHGAVSRLALVAALVLSVLGSACQNGSEGGGEPDKPVTFASDTLPVSTVEPGDMLAVSITGSSSEISKGFHVRFNVSGHSVDAPVSRVAAGQAFVMVPPMPEAVSSGVRISILDMNGKETDVHPQTLGISAVATTEAYTRGSFDAAVGGGLARLVELALEALDTLDAEGQVDSNSAAGVRTAFNQQIDILNQISFFNDNLDSGQMALLQQMLDNSGFLQFLADAAGVTLAGTGSQSSSLHSVWHAMIESALLKADFASLLLGEVRGALALLAYVMNQVSGWPLIGTWAQGVAAWATGLSATLQTPHDIINSIIPCDMVRMTGPSLALLTQGQSVDVQSLGRLETETTFNQQLLTQLIQTYVVSNVQKLIQAFGVSLPQQATSYLQQLATQIPGWIINWLTNSGYIQGTVMPGQSYTVLVIDNFALDMSQYRFDIAGIVANLLNLPYSAINAFFSWIGIGVGNTVGGYDGVSVANGNIVSYTPADDKLNGLAKGSTTVTYKAPMCRPAGGWWAQWGFYGIEKTQRNVSVSVQ